MSLFSLPELAFSTLIMYLFIMFLSMKVACFFPASRYYKPTYTKWSDKHIHMHLCVYVLYIFPSLLCISLHPINIIFSSECSVAVIDHFHIRCHGLCIQCS